MLGYIIGHCKKFLLNELKQHFIDKILEKHPYIDVNYIRDTICHEQPIFKDVENLFNVECFAYDFHESMEYANLTYEQQQIL